MARHWVNVTKGAIATVAAVLVVLALAPSGAVGTAATDELRADQSAAPPAGMSVDMSEMNPQPASVTFSAVSQREPLCVTDGSLTGDAVPTYVNILCPSADDTKQEGIVGFRGESDIYDGAWAYVMYVEIPDDIEDPKYSGGSIIFDDGSRRYLREASPSEIEGAWRTTLDVPDDQIAIVTDAHDDLCCDRNSNTVLYSQGGPTVTTELSFPSGVYDVRVVAYLPWSGGPPSEAIGERWTREQVINQPWRSRAIANAPTKSSSMTLNVGNCRADYDAPERLNGLDELKLEATTKFFEAKQEFDGKQLEATGNAFLFGFGSLAPYTDLADQLFPTPKNIKEDIDKANEHAKELEFWTERLELIEQRRNEVYAALDRCHGDNYVGTKGNVPGYEPLRPDELRRAKAAGISNANDDD